MTKLKVMTIFGTRPEAIKMAPVIQSLQKEKEIETIVTVSAQHRQMLDQVLTLFKIKTDYDLDIMKKNQSLAEITVRVLQGLEQVLKKEKPDLVLVHGDTTTSFVGALAAFYQQIKLAHIEAGLRTNNKYAPYPEEMNRQLTGVLTDLHFPPSFHAQENLLKEKVSPDKIFITGNTVIDALLKVVKKDYKFKHPLLKKINYKEKKIILLTCHRRENLGKPMEDIFQAVKEIVAQNKDIVLIFPVHLNPKIRDKVQELLAKEERIHLIEPLAYQSFAKLLAVSHLVLTDSGGLQEEAPALSKPVLVLRETTERVEAIKAGTVKLVGVKKDKIINTVQELLTEQKKYKKMATSLNPYGDGQASNRIVQKILFDYGLRSKEPLEFIREKN